ncbi:MAG TPA: sugar ABC transporter permease [Fimbriimonadaceae bacterium]|nr:sugar ABC transporter permease [Fimbriimonadaceae bacterium]
MRKGATLRTVIASKRRFALLYLLPAVAFYGFFVLWPLVSAFRLSLYDFTGLSSRRSFTGFSNYDKLFHSKDFFQALGNNIWLLVFCLGIVIVFAMLIAHAVQDDTPFGKFLRAVYLFPQVLSLVIVAMLWTFILHPNLGLIQPLLQPHGISLPGVDYAHGILGSASSARPAVGLTFIWYALGFYVMVLAAGIRGIPEDVKEAAVLDGASGLSRFRKVTWPLIWSVRRIVVIHVAIAIMNTFAIVRLMTDGGPDGATEVTLSYLYKRGFSPDSFYGEAAAIGVLNFAVAMLITLAVIMLFRRDPTEARR